MQNFRADQNLPRSEPSQIKNWCVSRVLKYPKKSLQLFEGRPRLGKNYSQMGWIGGPILQVAKKAIVRIEFFASFAIPSSSKS